jgi:hypothetical protein
MNENICEGDPLEGTRWENLTFNEYYNMSDEERQEFREYLISINAPYGDELMMQEEDDLPGVLFLSWRDIVIMSDDELDFYKQYWDARNSAAPMSEVEYDNYDD